MKNVIIFIMLLPMVLSVGASENLLCNPGFEDGVVGWFGDTAIPGWNIWGTDGWHCSDSDLPIYYYNNTKSITEWWDNTGVYQDFAVAEGTGYNFSVNAITPSCEPLHFWKGDFRVEWHDSNWNEISKETIGQFTDADTVDVWKCISGLKTAPVGAVNGRVVLTLEDWQDGASGKLYWDDVSVSVMDTVIAWDPIPSDAAEHISGSVILKWSQGKDVVSHNIYFGTDANDVNEAMPNFLAGDLEHNSQVDFADIFVLAEQWLTDPNGLHPSADISGDHNVNTLDFAIMANDWRKQTVYKGGQQSTSYQISGLEKNVTYYWRIDEVGDVNTYKGDIWSFTVISIEDLLAKMTLEEKIAQMGGDETAMSTPDNDRLGIPGFTMADGPYGVRMGNATCFPTPLAMGATWDADIIQQIGEALGREFRGKGRYVALGPCINIVRNPKGGRSFESMGEDPYLAGQLASAYVEGMQSQKVISVVKHLACNNQEDGRWTNNVVVNERTLREIYLSAFKVCVQDANAWGIMSAYNKMNGAYCSENSHLLTDILKDEWGFKGFVISDWGACHSTVESANAGLDVEMPHAYYFGQLLLDAVGNEQVSEDTIDKAVRGILWAKLCTGVFEELPEPNENVINCPEHQALALEAARKSIVLLKNAEAKLPLDKTAITTIAVIGPNADIARPCGGGSSHVTPYYAVSPLEGIENKVGTSVQVNFAKGCCMDSEELLYPIQSSVLKPTGGEPGQQGLLGEYFNNQDLQGTPVLSRVDALIDFDWGEGSPAPAVDTDYFSARWTGKIIPEETGQYTFGTKTDDGVRLYLDGELLIDDWNGHAVKTNLAVVALNAGCEYDIIFEYYEGLGDAVAKLCWVEPSHSEETLIAEACQIAAEADVAVVFVGTTEQMETEGFDRDSLALPGKQNQLIQDVFAANPNTVVAVVSGSAVLMNDWIDSISAVMQCWFNGQETGNAIADVLFGDQNPAGRLPISFPLTEEQLPPFDNNYEAAGEGPGYRYYDRQQIEPLFPFGHGLSYTQFGYSNIQINPAVIPSDGQVSISVDVTNVGSRQGDEVVQLYVHDVSSSVLRAVKELKGFDRISLEPAQTKTVTFILSAEKLAFYDVAQEKFVVEPGMFEVMVGSSSADIRLTGSFEVE